MELGILFVLAPFVLVIAIVALVQAGRTARHWMDWRMRVTEQRLERGSPTVRAAIEELRGELAALKQRETDAIFTFDASLERMESRMQRLEQRVLAASGSQPTSLGAGEPPSS